jgi:hypothetical protein
MNTEPVVDLSNLLRGRRIEDFPSRDVYPPPDGMDKDGYLDYKCFGRDRTEEHRRLEVLWYHIYDTHNLMREHGNDRYSFFQNPAGRSILQTNVSTAGQLSFPKRFYIWELMFQLDDLKHHILIEDAVASIRIGEANCLRTPISAFLQRPGFGNDSVQYFLPLCRHLLIPSVQNFVVGIDCGKPVLFPSPVPLRCFLGGYLCREVQ